jgi:hypothetical protein
MPKELPMKKSHPLTSVENPIYERVHTALHNLWSKSVGRPDYVKPEWTELEQAIQELAREADRRGEPSAIDKALADMVTKDKPSIRRKKPCLYG